MKSLLVGIPVLDNAFPLLSYYIHCAIIWLGLIIEIIDDLCCFMVYCKAILLCRM
jgi:hypothetical protein